MLSWNHLTLWSSLWSLYLFKVWNKQHRVQSGEELTNHSLQRFVEIRPVLHRKHILSGGRVST